MMKCDHDKEMSSSPFLCHTFTSPRLTSPLVSQIDFSQLTWFNILTHRPRCYPLTRFGIEIDQPQTYNYWQDTFEINSRPKLGFAGGRSSANMTPLHAPIRPVEKRFQSDYTENEMESLSMGIGLSFLEKDKEKLVEKKKQMVSSRSFHLSDVLMFSSQQWSDALAAKRKEEAELKEQLLQEEQQRLLEEASAIKQAKLQEKVDQENERLMKLEAEADNWKDMQTQVRESESRVNLCD
jgi:hypothetical protein